MDVHERNFVHAAIKARTNFHASMGENSGTRVPQHLVAKLNNGEEFEKELGGRVGWITIRRVSLARCPSNLDRRESYYR